MTSFWGAVQRCAGKACTSKVQDVPVPLGCCSAGRSSLARGFSEVAGWPVGSTDGGAGSALMVELQCGFATPWVDAARSGWSVYKAVAPCVVAWVALPRG